MQRRNKTSSRKRFFQDLRVEGTSTAVKDRQAYESEGLDGTSSRRRFFQNLIPERITEDIPSDDGIGTSSRSRYFQNLRIKKSRHEFADTSANEEDVSFQEAGTVQIQNELFDNIEDDTLEISRPFGQAYYQKHKQGTITEYIDFGDNTFQCLHCGASYWQHEKTSRGIYTGCCEQGQVRYKPGQVYLEKDSILPYVANVDFCDARCVSETQSKRTTLLFFRGWLKRNVLRILI